MGRLNSIHKLLIDNEIDDKYAKDLISRAKGDVPKNCEDKDLILKIKALMIDDLKCARKSETSLPGPTITFFIGPSGAGRTSALVNTIDIEKYIYKHLGLIAADSWKFCSTEQILQMSKILKCPFTNWIFLSEDKQDIKSFIDENPDLEHILVDTLPYYRFASEEWIGCFDRLYSAFEGYTREVKLVISMTEKLRDLIGITDCISQRYDFSFIFTKLDETETHGIIYDLQKRTGKPVDYVSYGPWFCSGFERFDAEKYIDNLLKIMEE